MRDVETIKKVRAEYERMVVLCQTQAADNRLKAERTAPGSGRASYLETAAQCDGLANDYIAKTKAINRELLEMTLRQSELQAASRDYGKDRDHGEDRTQER